MGVRNMGHTVLVVVSMMIMLVAVHVHAKDVSEEFKIVPNKAGSVEVALDTPPIASSTCKFEWQSTGATVEQWVMQVRGDPGSGELECEIGRRDGGGSYLLFTKFKTTLGTNPVLEAIVHDNDGVMHEDSFETEGECVQNAKDWSGGSIRKMLLKSMAIS